MVAWELTAVASLLLCGCSNVVNDCQGVAMPLLGCCGWLPERCNADASVVVCCWGVAVHLMYSRHGYNIMGDYQGVAKQLLRCCEWLLEHCNAFARMVIGGCWGGADLLSALQKWQVQLL